MVSNQLLNKPGKTGSSDLIFTQKYFMKMAKRFGLLKMIPGTRTWASESILTMKKSRRRIATRALTLQARRETLRQ
jgi:hypothetical protein